MFKTRFSQWRLSKNTRGDDYFALALLYEASKAAGNSDVEFLIRDRRKTVADLRAYIRSKKMTEEEFLQAAQGFTVPAYIQCVPIDPAGTRTSPSSSSEDRPMPSPIPSSNGLQLTPSSSGSGSYPSPVHYPPARRRPTYKSSGSLSSETMDRSIRLPSPTIGPEEPGLGGEDYVLVPGPSNSPSEASPSSSSCDQIQRDVWTMSLQVVDPVPLMSRHGAEDIGSWVLVNSREETDGLRDNRGLCSKCHQDMSKHCLSLEAFAPSAQEPRSLLSSAAQDTMVLPSTTEGHGKAWRWMAYCFSACVYMNWGDLKLSTESLSNASAEFEEMLLKNDRLTLMSLNLMLTMLHMHDQGSIAGSIVRSALEVAERVLSTHDPIRATIAWMVTVADHTLQKGGRDGEVLLKLEEINRAFERDLGAANPTTIASRYNVAWMLCRESEWEEAEHMLYTLYETCSSSLGPIHIQSLMVLSTLSRAQSRQRNYSAAMRTIEKAIHDSESTLGCNHPYRLELKRRLALMYRDIGEKEQMEELYWDVLKGRIKMLGPQHGYTAGAKEDLEGLLKELGKWNEDGSTQWSIDKLFENTSPSSLRHEAY
jgi:tetratricopeptide (TPR) repeat protein